MGRAEDVDAEWRLWLLKEARLEQLEQEDGNRLERVEKWLTLADNPQPEGRLRDVAQLRAPGAEEAFCLGYRAAEQVFLEKLCVLSSILNEGEGDA